MNTIFKGLSITLSILALGACSTGYQEMGLTGGVEAEQMSADIFRITARGNGMTEKTTVEDYVLLESRRAHEGSGWDALLNNQCARCKQSGGGTHVFHDEHQCNRPDCVHDL